MNISKLLKRFFAFLLARKELSLWGVLLLVWGISSRGLLKKQRRTLRTLFRQKKQWAQEQQTKEAKEDSIPPLTLEMVRGDSEWREFIEACNRSADPEDLPPLAVHFDEEKASGFTISQSATYSISFPDQSETELCQKLFKEKGAVERSLEICANSGKVQRLSKL